MFVLPCDGILWDFLSGLWYFWNHSHVHGDYIWFALQHDAVDLQFWIMAVLDYTSLQVLHMVLTENACFSTVMMPCGTMSLDYDALELFLSLQVSHMVLIENAGFSAVTRCCGIMMAVGVAHGFHWKYVLFPLLMRCCGSICLDYNIFGLLSLLLLAMSKTFHFRESVRLIWCSRVICLDDLFVSFTLMHCYQCCFHLPFGWNRSCCCLRSSNSFKLLRITSSHVKAQHKTLIVHIWLACTAWRY